MRKVVLLLVLFLVAPAQAGTHPIATKPEVNGHEIELVEALDLARTGRIDEALTIIKRLVEDNPKFRLAQVIYGDLLLAEVQPIQAFGNLSIISDQLRTGLQQEAHKKFRHFITHPPADFVPASLLKMSADQKWAIVVDVSESRLYLFEKDGEVPRLVSDHYITIGKNGSLKTKEGDKKTPIGAYFITRRISPRFLDDFYGSGALPINYPNEWDTRLRRTGYGIWLHGVSSEIYNRFPNASDGCIALSNSDLSSIWNRDVSTNTPVIITQNIDWVDRDTLLNLRQEFMSSLERWRDDWESLNAEKYLNHYSRNFISEDEETYEKWSRRKVRVNERKKFIDVELSNINFYSYPLEQDLIVVNFDQDYKSTNYSSNSKKRQYWRKESDGQWRIVYEGQARFREIHIKGIPPSARN